MKVDNKNSIALKVSSFGDVDKLRRLNEFQNVFRLIENFYLENNSSTEYDEYIKHLKTYNLTHLNIKGEDIKELIETIEEFNYENSGTKKIKPFDLNIHEIFLNPENSSNKKFNFLMNFLKNKFELQNEEIKMLKEYTNIIESRLEQVFSYAIDKSCSIMIDAEQSYLQHHFDYYTAYVFKIYNKEKSILSTTLQCYLNNQLQRLDKIYNFCREYNLKLGIKLVRGAYLNEENKLAEENGYPSPICDSFEETNNNYNSSLTKIFKVLEEKEKVKLFFY